MGYEKLVKTIPLKVQLKIYVRQTVTMGEEEN